MEKQLSNIYSALYNCTVLALPTDYCLTTQCSKHITKIMAWASFDGCDDFK